MNTYWVFNSLEDLKLSNLHPFSCLIPCNSISSVSKVIWFFLHWPGWGSEVSSRFPKVRQCLWQGCSLKSGCVNLQPELWQSRHYDDTHLNSEETEWPHPTWNVRHLIKLLLISNLCPNAKAMFFYHYIVSMCLGYNVPSVTSNSWIFKNEVQGRTWRKKKMFLVIFLSALLTP